MSRDLRKELSERVHDELWDAISSVYKRHDSLMPLNHVNVVEWMEAVAPIIAREWDEGWDKGREIQEPACPDDYNPHRKGF